MKDGVFVLFILLVPAPSAAIARDGGHSRETSWGNQDKVFARSLRAAALRGPTTCMPPQGRKWKTSTDTHTG